MPLLSDWIATRKGALKIFKFKFSLSITEWSSFDWGSVLSGAGAGNLILAEIWDMVFYTTIINQKVFPEA